MRDRRQWSDLFGALGQSVLELLGAEIGALSADFAGTGKGLLVASILFAAAAFLGFWLVALLVAAVAAVLALWMPWSGGGAGHGGRGAAGDRHPGGGRLEPRATPRGSA